MANIESSPPIVLNIWDKDESVLDGDDYLGRCVIKLNEAASNLTDFSDEDDDVKLNKVPPP